jgi:hypothetical protein
VEVIGRGERRAGDSVGESESLKTVGGGRGSGRERKEMAGNEGRHTHINETSRKSREAGICSGGDA